MWTKQWYPGEAHAQNTLSHAGSSPSWAHCRRYLCYLNDMKQYSPVHDGQRPYSKMSCSVYHGGAGCKEAQRSATAGQRTCRLED